MSTKPVPNEIVHVLISVVLQALDDGRDDRGLPAARDVAQVLGLDGLDRALSVFRPGDPGTEPIARQLRKLCETSSTEGSLEPFVAADPELGRLAVECGGIIEGEPGLPPDGTLSAAEALEDLPLGDDASRAVASRVRFSPQVAAAVRAALDWLCEGDAELRRIRLRTEDSALEIACPRVHSAGLAAAAKVLAAIGGNLGPAAVNDFPAGRVHAGSWVIRVPIVTARETFLMVSQGDLELALPWHAVLRLVMTPRTAFESHAPARGVPVLAPLTPLTGDSPEYPVVLVGHGLKRAYFVADRLIWRLPAETCEAEVDPRVPGHARCVRSEDGKVYRVADPARLLEAVAPLEIADPEPAVVKAPAPISPAAAPEGVEPEPGPVVAAGSAAPIEPSPAIVDAAAALAMLDPSRVTPLPLRALVAEDSISARLVLVMLLEQRGFEVRAVASAAELFEALEAGPWALVCVDAELPDAGGPGLLFGVRERTREVAAEAAVIALTRDGADEASAIEAGVAHSLRKPYIRGAVARLLDALDLNAEAP